MYVDGVEITSRWDGDRRKYLSQLCRLKTYNLHVCLLQSQSLRSLLRIENTQLKIWAIQNGNDLVHKNLGFPGEAISLIITQWYKYQVKLKSLQMIQNA
jgi:hypothetical protein